MLAAHPVLARILAGLLALCAVVALLGAYGLAAAVLGALAWFALPETAPAAGRRRTTLSR